jgi:hypothetical protein
MTEPPWLQGALTIVGPDLDMLRTRRHQQGQLIKEHEFAKHQLRHARWHSCQRGRFLLPFSGPERAADGPAPHRQRGNTSGD